jgi:hypothetical protein
MSFAGKNCLQKGRKKIVKCENMRNEEKGIT